MKNSVDVSVEFSFKGEAFAPSATLDLDAFMASGGSLSELHPVLARASGIDTYSYLYEVMEMADIRFSNAQGKAVGFLHGDEFDLAGYERFWREEDIAEQVQPIASEILGITDLNQDRAIRAALIKAYRLGKGE